MRLIDADALPISFDGHTISVWKKDLDAAPTINPYEWISVEDRLPTWEYGKVLIYTPYGISIAQRTTSNRWKGDCAIPKLITHWMPLPTPPTEKEN